MINKFLSYTRVHESGCIVWTKYIRLDGYCSFWDKKRYLAHRWIYEYYNGLIPNGMYVDHTCRNRSCVNIEHLRIVNPRTSSIENNLGPTAINSHKTTCKNGHLLTDDNLYYGRNGKKRICKKCRLIQVSSYQNSNKDKVKVRKRKNYLKNRVSILNKAKIYYNKTRAY